MGASGPHFSRRTAFAASLGLVAATGVAGCAGRDEETVSATEDLMREHGVLRRVLIVYRECAPRIVADPARFDAGALGSAAELFRTFGEEYHERRLEETHIFPALRKAGGPLEGLVDTLLAQHARGREITAFIAGRCLSGKVAAADAEPLARALVAFARMYESHTAFEDTLVFQIWRNRLSARELAEAGEAFEAIEHEQFRGDGFDMAVDRIADIERRLGLSDLALYTAPPPG
jgi:hemerythrin-like domain-containing protein